MDNLKRINLSGYGEICKICTLIRRIVWRVAPSVPLKCDFVAAGRSAASAEMTQLRRNDGSNPPLHTFRRMHGSKPPRMQNAIYHKGTKNTEKSGEEFNLTAKSPRTPREYKDRKSIAYSVGFRVNIWSLLRGEFTNHFEGEVARGRLLRGWKMVCPGF